MPSTNITEKYVAPNTSKGNTARRTVLRQNNSRILYHLSYENLSSINSALFRSRDLGVTFTECKIWAPRASSAPHYFLKVFAVFTASETYNLLLYLIRTGDLREPRDLIHYSPPLYQLS